MSLVNLKTNQEEGQLGKLLLKQSIPCVIGLLITASNSFADAIFVSMAGTEQQSATYTGIVSAFFPVVLLAQAIGYIFGIGGGCAISRVLVKKDCSMASSAASFALFSALLLGILLSFLGIFFWDSVMEILKVREEWSYNARHYSLFLLISFPFSIAVIATSGLLRGEGKTFYAMVGLAVAGLCNLLLTPFFLFGLEIGLFGVSLSNTISNVLAFGVYLFFYLKRKTVAALSIGNIFSHPKIAKLTLSLSLPSVFRQGFVFASSFAMNRLSADMGSDLLSAMSIVSRVMALLVSIPIGIGQGYQPIVGYYDSLKEESMVGQLFLKTVFWGTVLLFPLIVSAYWGGPCVVKALLKGAEIVPVAELSFRMQVLALPFLYFGTIVNMSYQATAKKWRAIFLACLRQGILYLPILYSAVVWCGETGLAVSQAVTDFSTFLVSIPFAIVFYRNAVQLKKLRKRV